MRRFPLLFLLAAISVSNFGFQSGRRINTPPSTTPPAPIQPPVNPVPEIKSTAPRLTEMLFLSESIRERRIKGINDKDFRLSDFEGKVMVINIWASWCGPCRREVPEYEKVRTEFESRGVVFIGLTTEDPRGATDRVQRFLREVNFGFRLGWADRELQRTLMNGRNAIPQTLVIDTEGRVVHHWTGYAPGSSGNRLKRSIQQALASE
ncbi:MAG TPA: TlpA disulfide reductase family protein [Pyrinomonadaceae bacterium]|nr:TlpA disulfide reductase family protein [Pyrinomonadaceae bacterium]